jgi:hypothetical protein
MSDSELERQQDLAKQLCDSIDECEAMKVEISILREYADALNARLKVESAQ